MTSRQDKSRVKAGIIEPLLRFAVPIGDVFADPANTRSHGERSIRAIAASLARFGQQKPILIGKDRVVVAGNGTLEAARLLGWTEIAAVETALEGNERVGFAIADNRTAELSEWDEEALAKAMANIEGELREAVGFLDEELAAIVAEDKEVVEDEVPALPKVAVTRPGDIWILGDHRLMCGDSTKAEDVGRLMGGERARLMNTDPPYGVGYANDERPNPGVAKPRVAKPRVANDGLQDDKLQAFLEACFHLAVDVALVEDAAWYMWHAHLTQGYFAAAAAAAAANVVLHRQIIWVKPVLVLGRGQYHSKHEPCFMGWVKGNEPPDYGEGGGERTQTTVWEIAGVTPGERKELGHSTPKPVKLFAIPIVKHTRKGEAVYEPFSGSGPQIIAAEQLGRRCFAMEIDPLYCDVAVKRWENLTGKKAELQV